MRRLGQALALVVLLAAALPRGVSAADDWDVAGGHFFTQTGGGAGKGYLVTDEGGIRFWSEFKRLGGVQAVGYPASQRFTWDGFTVQVFQRVIFQWRPESNSVAFVNVFDRLSQLGKDAWLTQVRQTPRPTDWSEAGKAWDAIVRDRLAVLDAYPSIKAKYNAVVGDAVQANGLPTSVVTDQGNHYALRCQRVVFQQWKEDVPWAKRGEVTVALGGDIAKETGVLPNPAALQPTTAVGGGAAAPGGTPPGFSAHDDDEKAFLYPAGWEALSLRTSDGRYMFNYYCDVDRQAKVINACVFYMAPFRMGPGFNPQDWFAEAAKSRNSGATTFERLESTTINGDPATLAYWRVGNVTRGVDVAVVHGANLYYFGVDAVSGRWSDYEQRLMTTVHSFRAKRAD